jgi:hypothetical protein
MLQNHHLAARVNLSVFLRTEYILIQHAISGKIFVLAVRKSSDDQNQPIIVGMLLLLKSALDFQRLEIDLEFLQQNFF